MVIGAGKLENTCVWLTTVAYSGIDNGTAGDVDYFYDKFAGTIFGDADEFVAIAPGNVQLLTLVIHKGAYKKQNDSFTLLLLIHSLVLNDMRWKYNDCDEFEF